MVANSRSPSKRSQQPDLINLQDMAADAQATLAQQDQDGRDCAQDSSLKDGRKSDLETQDHQDNNPYATPKGSKELKL